MTDRRQRRETSRDDAAYDYYNVVYGGRTIVVRRRRPDHRPLYTRLPAHLQGPAMLRVPYDTLVAIAAGANHDDTAASSTAVRSSKRARVAGATEAAIQGLPVVTPSKVLMQAECAVCLKDFVADDKLRAMPCSHAFHEQCIFQWLRCKASCPLCRQHLPPPAPTQDKDDNEIAAAQLEDPILSTVTRQDD